MWGDISPGECVTSAGDLFSRELRFNREVSGLFISYKSFIRWSPLSPFWSLHICEVLTTRALFWSSLRRISASHPAGGISRGSEVSIPPRFEDFPMEFHVLPFSALRIPLSSVYSSGVCAISLVDSERRFSFSALTQRTNIVRLFSKISSLFYVRLCDFSIPQRILLFHNGITNGKIDS